MGKEKIEEITNALKASIEYSKSHYDEVVPYVQELSPVKDLDIIQKSVNFWVNDETVDMSSEGKRSINELIKLSQGEDFPKHNVSPEKKR